MTMVVLLILPLMGCPGGDDCNDLGRVNISPDLITITPLQTVYTQGDEIIFKVSIPNLFDGVNLLQETGDTSALLILGAEQLFINNDLIFIKGSQGNHSNWFNMPYEATTDSYELEVKIVLNKIGQYSFFTDDYIEFIGNGCNNYEIDTNIEGMNTNNKIEFEVQ